MGPDNVRGYQHVVALVDYLYTLGDKQSPVVTNAEAENIIRLWNNLSPYDQRPRFKAPKRARVDVPGVQSVKR